LPEYPYIAGQLFVDHVGNLVRGGAQLRRRDGVAEACQLGLLDRVQQAEADVQTAVELRDDAADHQRVGTQGAPVCIAYFGEVVGLRRNGAWVDELEQAAALQVSADDLGQFLCLATLVGERYDRDRDRVGGAADDLYRHCAMGRRRAKKRCS
jgi:hypothetical protein